MQIQRREICLSCNGTFQFEDFGIYGVSLGTDNLAIGKYKELGVEIERSLTSGIVSELAVDSTDGHRKLLHQYKVMKDAKTEPK